MGAVNNLAAFVWQAWKNVQARSVSRQQPTTQTRILYAPRAEAGVRVTEENSITYAAVFACTRVIAETMATLSWHVFRTTGPGKERVSGIIEYLLRDQPNPETTAFSWREHMVSSALLWGGGYSEIVRDGAGRVAELWQIAPDRVMVDRVNRTGRIVYVVDNGWESNTVLEKDQVFHLHGLGFDGLTGYSVVRLAARTIGIGMAADRFGASFYGNGTWTAGALRKPEGNLSANAIKNLRESWAEMHSGPDRAFRPAILEEGLEWVQFGMPLTDAQFLENRKFQVTEVARWFRVPPHKLADLERATFSNIEHQSLEFVQDTVLPWAIRLEQEANIKLFGSNRQGFFTKLNLNSLLRGDAASRFRAYSIGRQWGWLSANDVRELEDMNSIGEQGDVYLIPMNMVDAKTPPTAATEPTSGNLQVTEEESEPEQSAAAVLRSAHRDLLASALTRIAKREQKWADSARRKFSGAELSSTIMGFLTSEGHQSYINDAVMPSLMAFARIVFAGQITDDVERALTETIELTIGARLVETQERLLSDGAPTFDVRLEADRLIDRVVQLRMTITNTSEQVR